MKQKVILIISVVIGLLAAFLTHSYLAAKDREVMKWKEDFDKKHRRIEVAVVKNDVAPGETLTLENIGGSLIFESVYRDQVVKAKDALALVGRKAQNAIKANSAIFWQDIVGGEPGGRGLASEIKKERRAISVNVSGSGSVSGMVRPNDHVDVLGTFSFPSKTVPGEMELVTMTMMQDVLVLATGRETAKSQLLANSRSGISYNMVTLEVTPREAEMLVFAEQIKGRISLSLRNPDDIYFEKTLPRVDFQMIQDEIEQLNLYRQQNIMRKRSE